MLFLDLINEYDTDGSGQIEFPEFCNMMSAKMAEDNDEDMVRLAFRTLDKDGSGTISTDEFKHLMLHIGEYYIRELLVSISCAGDTLTPEEVQQIINAADKDGDGSLSYEEFVKIMLG